MNPGELNRRITFQTKSTVKDNEGIATENWVDGNTVWAKIHTYQGKEYFKAAAVEAQNDYHFIIRYQKSLTVTPDMRIRYGTRYFNIKSAVNKDELRKEIHIMATEVVDGE